MICSVCEILLQIPLLVLVGWSIKSESVKSERHSFDFSPLDGIICFELHHNLDFGSTVLLFFVLQRMNGMLNAFRYNFAGLGYVQWFKE